ncbi:hypothetical protein LCGC14_0532500 [marine sediment metagenome]|uniref:Uncharacterized protein n=1 Tax=marine sediment metagenome TaxID=412755 RepID=A0A0F9UGQ2_9ZZZZ
MEYIHDDEAQFAIDNAPPIPEGQRCESDNHMEMCFDSYLVYHACQCEECGKVFSAEEEDDLLEQGDTCPNCEGEHTLNDDGLFWTEEEPLAEVPIFQIDKEKGQVCVTFFCEFCGAETEGLRDYISEEGGWPTQDGELIRPNRCSEL